MNNEGHSYSGLGVLCPKLVLKLLSPGVFSLISEETCSKTSQSYQNTYVLGAQKRTSICLKPTYILQSPLRVFW